MRELIEDFLPSPVSDLLRGWRAAAMALAATGPGLVWAAATSDKGVTFSGLATGAIFSIWGIWTYGSGLMLRSMQQRLKLADLLIDELRSQRQAALEECGRMRVIIAELEEGSGERRIARQDRPA